MGLTVVDNIGEGAGRWRLGSMIGGAGGGGAGEGNVNSRDRWGQAMRNSSVVGMSPSRFNKELSLQTRVPADCCWGTVVSSLSSSEEKKSGGWFRGVLGGDSGCEGSCQLELFKVEMMAVHEGMTLVGKLDL